MSDFLDLDVLMPAEKIIKIGGKKVNVGFIPAGSTWEIQRIQNQAAKLDQKKIEADDPKETAAGIELTFQICAAFCEPQYKEMNTEWFKTKVPIQAVQALATEINKTLARTLKDIEAYSKNEEAGQ